MKTFKDNAGRPWTVNVTVSGIKRVRDVLGLDLLDTTSAIPRLMIDPVLLCDVAYVLLKPQCDQQGVTDEQFGEGLAGDAITLCRRSVLEAITDFFDDPADRKRIGEILPTVNQFLQQVRQTLDRAVKNPEIKRRLAETLAELGEPSTSLPERLESTPGPSPLES